MRCSWDLPALRSAAARCFEHLTQSFFCLEKSVLRSGLADLQNRSDFRMAEPLDFIQEKNVALVPGQSRQCAFKRDSQSGMSRGGARFRPSGFTGFFVSDFLFAHATAANVIAGIDQHAKGPRRKTGLAAKTCDAPL